LKIEEATFLSPFCGMADGDDDVPLILTWDDATSGLLEEDEREYMCPY